MIIVMPIEVIVLNLIQITIAGCRLWASTRGGATSHVLSVIQGARKIDP